MAGVVGKLNGRAYFHLQNGFKTSKAHLSTFNAIPRGRKIVLLASGALATGAATLVYSLEQSVKAHDFKLHPPHYPWNHEGAFASFDHASLRRGYEVYKQVCSTCHSLKFVCYRNLVGVSHTEEEAKVEASEIQVLDGPDDDGEMFKRPGKLSDHFPVPYPNKEAARAANNGNFPPDLTYIILARHGAEDYIFSLLTGYCDPPAGVDVPEGLHYNPFFKGGQIGMAKALFNELIEYSDGTPATASQMAKDVVTFLRWAGEPEWDDRKRIFLKAIPLMVILFGVSWYWKRQRWTSIKSRKIAYKPKS